MREGILVCKLAVRFQVKHLPMVQGGGHLLSLRKKILVLEECSCAPLRGERDESSTSRSFSGYGVCVCVIFLKSA